MIEAKRRPTVGEELSAVAPRLKSPMSDASEGTARSVSRVCPPRDDSPFTLLLTTTMLTHRTSTSSRGDRDESGSGDLPSQTFHPNYIPLPQGILSTAAGGAHYSGAKTHHRRSDIQRASASGSRDSELSAGHQRILDDLCEVRALEWFMLR